MNTHKNSNDDELQINFTPDLDQEPDIPLVIKDEGWLKKMKQWWRKFFN